LNHYLDAEWMRYAYECTRKDDAVGVDGQTAEGYALNLERNLADLLDRLKSGRYRAPPVRRHYVVDQVTFSDPSSSGSTYQQSFWYAGASINLQGRGFAGFGAQQRYDLRSGIWETRNTNRAFPYTGMLSYDVAARDNLNSKPIGKLTNSFASTTLDGTANNQRYFPYVSGASKLTYELGGTKDAQLITTTSTSYTLDNYGNATDIATTVTDNDSGSPYSNQQWTTTAATSYTPIGA
jgi:hypothetical protein